MLIFSSASSVNPRGCGRDTKALNVAPTSLVADALVVICDGRGKGIGAESKGQRLNQVLGWRGKTR